MFLHEMGSSREGQAGEGRPPSHLLAQKEPPGLQVLASLHRWSYDSLLGEQRPAGPLRKSISLDPNRPAGR